MKIQSSITADAANPTASCALQLGALDRLLDNPALRFTRAGTITQTQNAGELRAMIVRRASRLRFPNEIQRQRYIQRHSLACSGDA